MLRGERSFDLMGFLLASRVVASVLPGTVPKTRKRWLRGERGNI